MNYLMTESGFSKLQDELHQLETAERRRVAERIKVAREFGDISENSEYDDAKNEQALLEKRIADLRYQLSHADVVADKSVSTQATIGSIVKLRVENGKGERLEEVFIGGHGEVGTKNGKKIITTNSPIGSAIDGLSRDETAVVETPAGKQIITVLDVH